jgi:hypothetical protein
LLHILDIRAALTYYSRAQMEVAHSLYIDRDFLFWPFAPSILVSLEVIAPSKTPFVDKRTEILVDELISHSDSSFDFCLDFTGDMQVHGRIAFCRH